MNMPNERPDYTRPGVLPARPRWNDSGNLEIELSADEREALDGVDMKMLTQAFETSLRAIAHMRRHNEIPNPQETYQEAHRVARWMAALTEEVMASGTVSLNAVASILGVSRSTVQYRRALLVEQHSGDGYRTKIAYRRGDVPASEFYGSTATAAKAAALDGANPGRWVKVDDSGAAVEFETPTVAPEGIAKYATEDTGAGALGFAVPGSTVTVDNSERYDEDPTDITIVGGDVVGNGSGGDVMHVGGNIRSNDLALSGAGPKVLRTGSDGRRVFEIKGYTLQLNGVDVSMAPGQVREVAGWELSATLGGGVVGREL